MSFESSLVLFDDTMTDRRLISLLLTTALASCNGASSPFESLDSVNSTASGAQAIGAMFMSGRDTAHLGTTLEPGDIAFQFHGATSRIHSYVFVDPLSSILEEEYVDPDVIDSAQFSFGDPDQYFVLRVIDDELIHSVGVELEISVGGAPATYACNAEGVPGVVCEGVAVDRAQRILRFDSVTLLPVEGAAQAPLLLNGQFAWTAPGS